MWQPLSRLQFLQHESSNELFPVVGGLGNGGLERFVGLCQRPEFTDGNIN